MSLRKRWRPLERATIGSAPDAYGVIEFGDDEGDVLRATAGFLPDELREELSYGEASKVRWKRAQSRDHADRLLDDL
ncbi:hypothetical protein C499_18884 [Halogeometricum borinquense DSM 11551]|uniref:DUF7508 domain-containing protein n=2 Tax=Halogeometricum borinquense TaxID=60847 RepID=E4NND4_HALBP|nr:hypothetical protein [Halogeometricum borinquense]ADQ67472.1 hypothetical protein Hbor_19050 [Halogeometricum borinquense DSM 11551]ELY23846.1 hypothetical protein C499_18884 [Halogeometricum borinquense DSM 11551]RYJ13556.1 hypothetical protein ELS19_06000 [Halogeometricum borinquense]